MKLSFRIAAAALATTLAAAPANAQDLATLGLVDGLVTEIIDNADCNTLRTTLKLIDNNTEGVLMDENTTRNQLSHNLQALNGKNLGESGALALPAIRYSGKTADRALKCGLVKEDPTIGGNFALSSKLSDFAPLFMSLSSK